MEAAVCAAMILAYGDDSSDIVRTGGIPFHAHDCDSDHGDFEHTTHEENKALYRDLTIMAAESHVQGFAVVIDLIASQRVFPGSPELAYYRAFLRVIEYMKKCAEGNREMAEFTLDMRMESEHNAELLYRSVRETEIDWTSHLADKVSFEFSKKNPRLQVVDLFARESMKALDNKIGPVKRPPRKSWEALDRSHKFQIEVYSDGWFDGLKRDYPKLEEMVGFCEKDYLEWLKQRNRHHNMTNLILFIDWIARKDRAKWEELRKGSTASTA
jgi:hypothetical protein